MALRIDLAQDSPQCARRQRARMIGRQVGADAAQRLQEIERVRVLVPQPLFLRALDQESRRPLPVQLRK